MKLFSIVLVMSVLSVPVSALAVQKPKTPAQATDCPFHIGQKDPAPCPVVATTQPTTKQSTGSKGTAAPQQVAPQS